MSKQKARKKYYFSVEGQTEELYFEWLEKEINKCPNTSCRVSFDCQVEPDPIKRIKKMNIIGKTEIWHIYDYESNGLEHRKRFFDTIDKMTKAERMGKQVKYLLGYSNLTFDLWMILHKTNCYSSKPYNTAYLKDINKAYDENFQSMDEYKEKDNFTRCLSKISLNDVIQAVNRAKHIEQMNLQNGYTKQVYKKFTYYAENPSLDIWLAIKKILEDCQLIKQ